MQTLEPKSVQKISLVESLQLVEVVDHWHADQLESLPQGRSPYLNTLWTLLVDEYAYPGSYKSVRSFVRHRFPAAPKRPFRRIEPPPAAQVQSDWLETTLRLVGDDGTVQLVTLYGLAASRRSTASTTLKLASPAVAAYGARSTKAMRLRIDNGLSR